MKVLDKSLWGSEDGLTVVNKKTSADMTSASEINDIEILNQILMASNYEALIEEAYYIVEEGWQDDISKLHGLHHTIIEGKLVLSFSKCRGLYVQHQNDTNNGVNHIERHCKSLGINMMKQSTRKHLQEGEEIINGTFKIQETVQLAPSVDEQAAMMIKQGIAQKKSGYVLRPTIKAITAGLTGNNHRFISKFLQGDPEAEPYPSGIYSYTKPYPKPMLLNHDTYFGDPLGRITLAQYLVSEGSGGAVYIYPEIVHPDAIEKILDSRYLTVSVGATTDRITCNICGQEFMQEGFCEHDRFVKYDDVECQRIDGVCNICGAEGNCEHVIGDMYDDVEAEWFLGQIWFDECSFVNVPADPEAQVVHPGTKPNESNDVQPMEAYLGLDNELYNINDDSIQSHTELFGMSIKNFKEGGLDNMSEVNINDLQSKIEALTEEKDQLSVQLESLQTQLDEEKATLTSKVDELNEEKETMEAEKDQKLSELQTEKDELQTQFDELTAEKDTLSETNIALAAEAHNQLAERVADIKFILDQEIDKEAELKTLKSKDKEELQELLTSVMEELTKYDFSAQRVDNPGGSQNEGDETPMTDEEIAEQLVINLFKGEFKPINKRSEK